MQLLTREVVQRMAPSVFGTHEREGLSNKYQQYPTVKVMDKLDEEGWKVVKAQEQRVNVVGRTGFQKHLLRFRNINDINNLETGKKVGSEFFEIVLTNSHDGTSCYSISAGLYRLVCSNGLVVGSESFGVTLRHMGNTPKEVFHASMKIANQMPRLMDGVNRMKAVNLSEVEQNEFARKAYNLKWDEKPVVKELVDEFGYRKTKESTVFNPGLLLAPRRYEDNKQDLWSVFNRVQENMVKGSYRRLPTNNGRRAIRSIASINENLRVNKALWNLADEVVATKK